MEYDGRVVIGIDGDASGLVQALDAVNDAINSEFKVASALLRTAGAGLTDAASAGIVSRLTTARDAGTRVAQAVSEGIDAGKGRVVTAAQNVLKQASASAIDSESWRNVGKNIVYGMESGIVSSSYRLAAAAANAAYTALEAAKRVLGIASPSKRAEEEIGVQIPRGIANGILREMPEIYRAMDGGLDAVVGRVRAGVMAQNGLMSYSLPVGAYGTAGADRGTDRGGGSGKTVIEFTGSLAQLGRVLQPVIVEEGNRLGDDLVMA